MRKGDSGRELCNEGKVLVSYDLSLMNRWPNGCRKNVSFLGAARAAIVNLLTNFFKSFPIFFSLAFKGFPLRAPMYIPVLFLTHLLMLTFQ